MKRNQGKSARGKRQNHLQMTDKKSMRHYIFTVGVIVTMACCFCCSLLQMWIGMDAKKFRRQQAINSAARECPPDRPMLGIVLPLNADDIASTVELLQHWPTKCSETMVNRMDLIFYFANALPPGLDIQLKNTSPSTSCFKTTRVVSALLHHEVTHYLLRQLNMQEEYPGALN